jgi:uncharacterized membrane protein
VLLALLILLHVVVFTWLQMAKFARLEPSAQDLGAEAVRWREACRGRYFGLYYEPPGIELLVPAAPIYSLLLLWYALFPSPLMVALLQSLCIALAAWPLLLLARGRLGVGWSWLVVLGYFLHPGVSVFSLMGFRFPTLAFPTLFAYFAAWDRRSWRWAYLWGLLAALTITNVLVAVLLFAVVSAWRDGARRPAARTLVGGGTLLAVSLGSLLLVGRLRGVPLPLSVARIFGGPETTLLGGLLAKLSAIHWTRGHAILLAILAPLGLVPLAAGEFLLPVLPETVFVYLLDPVAATSALLIPFAFLAQVRGLERLLGLLRRPALRRGLSLVVAGATAAGHYFIVFPEDGIPPLARGFSLADYRLTSRHLQARRFLELVPDGATVAAPRALADHLIARCIVGEFPNQLAQREWEYILVDLEAPLRFTPPEALREALLRVLRSGAYGVVRRENGLVLLRRGADPAGNEALIRRLEPAPAAAAGDDRGHTGRSGRPPRTAPPADAGREESRRSDGRSPPSFR